MFVVDTNILLYAANEDSPHHPRCAHLVDRWRSETVPWHATWNILYEFLRVVTHRAVLRRPRTMADAVVFVDSLLRTPSFSVLVESPQHPQVLEQTIREVRGLSGNLAHDLHTAVLMREHGITRIVTHDHDFVRFPFLDVLDPLSTDGSSLVKESHVVAWGGKSVVTSARRRSKGSPQPAGSRSKRATRH